MYRLTEGVTGAWLRSKIRDGLDRTLPDFAEYLPAAVRRAPEFPAGIASAVEAVHFPPDFDKLDDALARLAFDELFALQLGMVVQSPAPGRAGHADRCQRPAAGYAVAAIEGVISARSPPARLGRG